MKTKTISKGAAASSARGLRNPRLTRALLRAMKGALRRSIVLLPLTEDDDKLQECLGGLFGYPA